MHCYAVRGGIFLFCSCFNFPIRKTPVHCPAQYLAHGSMAPTLIFGNLVRTPSRQTTGMQLLSAEFPGEMTMNHTASWFMTILAGIFAAVMMVFTPRAFKNSFDAFACAEDENGLRILGGTPRFLPFRQRPMYISYPQHDLYYNMTLTRDLHFANSNRRSCTTNSEKASPGQPASGGMSMHQPSLRLGKHKKGSR